MLVEILALVVGLVLAKYAFSCWSKYLEMRAVVNKIPGPQSTPVIGDLNLLRQDTFGYYLMLMKYSRQFSEHGIFKFWAGPVPYIWLFKASTVQEFLNSSKHMDKSFVYKFLSPWLGDSLFLITGEKWFARRKMITPSFHFKILEEFLHIFNEQSTVLVGHLDKLADGPAFNIRPYLKHLTLDIICEAAMGVKIDAQQDANKPYTQANYKQSTLLVHRMQRPWFFSDTIFNLSPLGRESTRCLRIIHDFTAQVITDRKALQTASVDSRTAPVDNSTASPGDVSSPVAAGAAGGGGGGTGKRRRLALLDMLLEEARLDPTLTDSDIAAEVTTFMFGGHDTTAVALLFIVYMLGCHQEEQLRVQREIDAVLGDCADRDVTTDDINELKYLDCVVKETLRLYPPAPWFSRTTSEPCRIGGFDIPKGVNVGFLAQALHLDPEYFPDPEKFDPDRWLTDDMAARHPFCYIPFSAGIRNCIGQRFAVLEVKTIVCHILRQFSVICSEKRENIIGTGLMILEPVKVIPVRLQRRHN